MLIIDEYMKGTFRFCSNFEKFYYNFISFFPTTKLKSGSNQSANFTFDINTYYTIHALLSMSYYTLLWNIISEIFLFYYINMSYQGRGKQGKIGKEQTSNLTN